MGIGRVGARAGPEPGPARHGTGRRGSQGHRDSGGCGGGGGPQGNLRVRVTVTEPASGPAGLLGTAAGETAAAPAAAALNWRPRAREPARGLTERPPGTAGGTRAAGRDRHWHG